MKGFRESTASITLSLTISKYECPFLLNTSICPMFYLIRQEVNTDVKTLVPQDGTLILWSSNEEIRWIAIR
jgi:hypothetical protein